ncbi:MAG: hypothetical protein U0667_15045 [Chloroflexota bacterium]
MTDRPASTDLLDVVATAEPWRLVVPAARPVEGPEVRLRLEPGDRALVTAGDQVRAGQDVLERPRERSRLEVPLRPDMSDLTQVEPGSELDPELFGLSRGVPSVGRPQVRRGDRVYLLYVEADRVAHAVVARSPEPVASPVDGVVTDVDADGLRIRASGLGIRGPVGWGQPVLGRVVVGVTGPDEELRASAIDISAAGAVLVAGARLDIEAVTRARAIGVAGILCGGAVGRELRQLEESDERQRAALHATTPFGLLALDGFGRRPMPILAWDLLVAAAAEGSQVAVVPEAGLAVVPAPPEDRLTRWSPDAVRITAGEGAGVTGRLVGLAGPMRRPGGSYQPSGFVVTPATAEGPARRRLVSLADLERLA